MKKELKILLITVLLALVFYNVLQKLNERFNWFGGHPVIINEINSISQVKDGLSPILLIDKAKELKLSAVQKKNIENLQNKYNSAVKSAKSELDIIIKKYQLIQNNHPTADKIEEINKDISRISAVIVTTRSYYWNNACKLLTTEQAKVLDHISTTLKPDERDKYR